MMEILRCSDTIYTSNSFYTFLDPMKIRDIFSHVALNTNSTCLLRDCFLKSQNFICNNSNFEEFLKGINHRKKQRLTAVNLISILQDPITTLKKLAPRNIILKLDVSKLQTNKTNIGQDIKVFQEALEKNSSEIYNTLFESESDFKLIKSYLLDDEFVLALAS